MDNRAAFAKQPRSDAHRLMAAWMAGYLTAHNLADASHLTSVWHRGVGWVAFAQYCASHPDRIAENGAQDSLPTWRRMQSAIQPRLLENDGSAVLLYVPVIARVRAALSEIGYRADPQISNGCGAESLSARSGPDVTGLPDQATLARPLR